MSEFKIILDTAAGGNYEKAAELLEQLVQKTRQLTREQETQSNSLQQAYSRNKKELTDTTAAIQKLEQAGKQRSASEEQDLTRLRQKQNELVSSVREYVNVQDAVKQAVSRQVNTTNGLLDAQRQKLKDLKESIQQAKSEYDLSKANAELQRTQEEIKRLTNLGRSWKNSVEVVDNSYTGLVQRNKELRQAMNKLPINDTTGQLNKLQKEFRQNTTELKKFDAELGQSFRNVGNYEEALKNAAGGLQGFSAIGRGGVGAGGALGGAIGGALPALGAVAAVGAGADAALRTFQEINDELRITQSITKLQGQSLNNLTGDIRAVKNVFDKDYNETLRASNALMENFGQTGTEAIDTIIEGLASGADINGDYLDQLAEYSVQFKAAGLSAQQLNRIIISGADKGIFSDKAADAVKEGTIRLREMTKATRDAITGIGLNADEIEKRLQTGTASIGDILAEVSGALDDLPRQSKAVGTAIADIFGGAGEDAGLDFLLTLQDINKSTEELRKNLSANQQALLDEVEASRAAERALVTLGEAFGPVGNSISTFTNTALAALYTGLTEILTAFQDTENVLDRFTTGLKTASADELRAQLKELEEQTDANEFSISKFLAAGGNYVQYTRLQAKAESERIGRIALVRQRLEELAQEEIKATEELKNSVPPVQLSQKELDALAESAKKAAGNIKKIDSAEFSTEASRMNQDLVILRKAWEAAFGEPFTQDLVEQNNQTLDKIDARIRQHAEDVEKAEQRKRTADQQTHEQRQRTLQDGLSAFGSVTDSTFQIFNNGLEREVQALEAAEQYKLSLAGDNEAARQRIQQATARQRAELMREQARNEKAQALFNIALYTAQGIIAALASVPPNVPLSIFVGATGIAAGIEAATRPIPSYRRGRKKGPAELAEVGEAGPELIVSKDPQGNLTSYLAAQRQVIYLEKDSQVVPAEETRRLLSEGPTQFERSTRLARPRPSTTANAEPVQQLVQVYRQQTAQLEQAVQQLYVRPIHQYIPDEHGLRRFIDRGGKRIEILNKRHSLGGEG